MTTLLKTEDTALLNEVEDYLQRQGVAYARVNGNQLKVDSEQHQWIKRQLRARDSIVFKTQSSQE